MSVKIKAKNPSNQLQTLLCDANGRLMVDAEVQIDNVGLATSALQGGGLPSALSGSGNLKVCLQELGNEGSERLNVDVGNTVSQLPTALTGAGNLKVSLEAMNGSGTGISTSAKQDTANGHLNSINSAVSGVATESTLNIIAEEFTKCDTDNVVITGGVILPASLTGAGNLKVCLQELGNEGSERLNVDVGDDITQLPSALSGGGRLKIENDFDGAITNSGLTALEACVGTDGSTGSVKCISVGGTNPLSGNIQEIAVDSAGHLSVDILTSALPSGASTSALQAGGLPSALSSDNLKVSLKETITVPVSNAGLTELASAINSDKVDVNISSGNISGFATATLQAGGLPSALSSDNLKVSLKETITVPVSNGALTELADAINSNRVDVNIANGGFDGAITHSALTELASALNSDKLDVNISSGNISGFSTSANQSTANGHLLALANVVNPAIATATGTTIPNKLDTIETTANAIETKTTLHTTSELKELLSGITIASGALSSEFDFENYRHARFFGITTSSVGTDFLVMGSNTSGGTYYVMGENLRSETIGSTHYIYSPHIENLPRYVKIINKSGSTNYIFSKLYVQLSEGRVAV